MVNGVSAACREAGFEEKTIKTIFTQGPFVGYRLVLAVVFSCALFTLDYHFGRADFIRKSLGVVLTPIHWVSTFPVKATAWFHNATTSKHELETQVGLLESRMLVLERKAQKYNSVIAENNRLRELLNASSIVDDTVVVAELIGVNPDPFSHQVVINKGMSDGIRVGNAVLDASGLMGQVIEAGEYTSRVLLISDSSHAVPVQVNRNGVRAIAYGVGRLDEIELANVPDTADIQIGDLLVSSGLGGRFPRGYPVATVIKVEHDPGQPFSSVTATPQAALNQSRLLLVVNRQRTTVTDKPAGSKP